MKRKLLARLLLFAILFGVTWWVRQRQQTQLPKPQSTTTTQSPKTDRDKPTQTAPSSEVPDYALKVLKYIRDNGDAPAGYVGGREFLNREKRLRAKDDDGKRIRYSEWDVHPKVQGQNRGAERLVTGSDHSAWFTANHYKSFIKIDN